MRKFIFVLVVGVIFSCKKHDDTPPEVNVVSLNTSQVLSFGDTLWVEVKGSANDDFGLQSVTVRVLDMQQKTWLRSDAQALHGASSAHTSFAIVIDDRYLPSGSYYVKAYLNDGTNESTDFVNYTINGLVKQYTGVLAIQNNGIAGAIVDTIGNNGAAGPWMSFSGSRDHLIWEAYSQQCWTSGEGVSQYQWSDANGLLLADESIPYPFTNSFFNDVAIDPLHQGVWAACADGRIRRIHQQGYITTDVSGANPKHLAVNEDYVMVESETPGTAEKVLFFHPSTGQLLHTWVHGESVLDMAVLDEQLMLAVQRAAGVQLLLFDLNTLLNINWSNIYSFTATSFSAVASMPNRLALSHENGVTIWDGQGNLIQQFPNAHPTQLEWNLVNGNLVGLENGQLYFYSIPAGTINGGMGAGYTRFALRYNK